MKDYKEMGRKGGLAGDKKKAAQTMKEKYGEAYFSVIGKMGAEKRRKLAKSIRRVK